MLEVSTEGSGVWDCTGFYNTLESISLLTMATAPEPSNFKKATIQPEELIEAKALPPFVQLTNDEDRELKALLDKPGRYHVVCNQKSFANLHDSDSEPENGSSTRTTPGIKLENRSEDDIMWDVPSYKTRGSLADIEGVDQRTVIVRHFEDPTPRRASNTSISRGKPSLSPESSEASSSPNDYYARYNSFLATREDYIYAMHYRQHISSRVMEIYDGFSGCGDSETPDFFEKQSIEFPPVCAFQLPPLNWGLGVC